MTVSLEPGQLLILADPLPGWPQAQPPVCWKEIGEAEPVWHVSFPGSDLPDFDTDKPSDVSAMHPRFSGTVRYETVLRLPDDCGAILLKRIAGAVRVWVDGRPIGQRVTAPYRFEGLGAGSHRLTIEATNTLVFRHRDPLSFFAYIPPTGLTGPVTLLKKATEEA